jgi:hypothetical protein
MFSQRPSALLGLLDETVCLDFDCAACEHLLMLEAEEHRRTAEEIKRQRRR